MQKLIYLCSILFLILAMTAPAAAAPAAQELPEPQAPDGGDFANTIYLPFGAKSVAGQYNVSGVVTDEIGAPLAGATVSDGKGHNAVTNADGMYSMILAAGVQKLTPSLANYKIPTRSDGTNPYGTINVTHDLSDQNFTLKSNLSPAADTEIVPAVSASFETSFWWNPISGMADGFTPYYTTEMARTLTHSGYTGIKPYVTWQRNPSWSRWRTQRFTVPTDATGVALDMWFYGFTDETVTSALKSADGFLHPSVPEGVMSVNTESIEAETLLDNDIQYVQVIDGYTNVPIGTTPILWQLGDSAAWGEVAVANLLTTMPELAGRSIKIEFGVFNDLDPYKTWAYWDDVSIIVSAPDSPTPTPSVCNEYALNNGGFEAALSAADWQPVGPEIVMPDRATTPEINPFAGTYSGRTGIPWNMVNPAPGVPQWSELYQNLNTAPLTVPANATRATLKAWLLPRSTYTWWWPYAADEPVTSQALSSYQANRSALATRQTQYVYLKGTGGTDTIDLLLMKWFHWNSYYWQYREFDITAYRGQAMSVVFGTANMGVSGNSALYIDNVSLEVCAPTATAK